MASERLVLSNFIGGQFQKSEAYLDSYDPSTGAVWALVPDSGCGEADEAVQAASKAQKSWANTSPQTRSQILLRIADILEGRLDEFALAESRDQGKPLWLAKTVDIPRAVYNFRIFATSILHHKESSTYMDAARSLNYTTRSPVGVGVLISPWNLPLYLLTFKIAPAIAWGNTVVCKPSEFTSVTAFMLCDVLNQADLPSGVVNMVFGTGPKVGHALSVHPLTRLVSFTGSVATAERIKSATAPMPKKLSLELGGKNPAIIFADADMKKCLQTTIRSSFLNQGEICLCTSRVFVQQPIYEDFLKNFVQETRKIKVGDPRAEGTWMGALISKEHLAKVRSFVKVAREENCQVLCGGDEPLDLPSAYQNGYFFPPTVITKVSDSSKLMQEEIFGPIVCVVPFDTEDEVIERANNVCYGLCASVWTSNASALHRVSKALEVGTVWANCWLVRDLHMPFGGVKASGLGREGIEESKEFYTEVKTVCVAID